MTHSENNLFQTIPVGSHKWRSRNLPDISHRCGTAKTYRTLSSPGSHSRCHCRRWNCNEMVEQWIPPLKHLSSIWPFSCVNATFSSLFSIILHCLWGIFAGMRFLKQHASCASFVCYRSISGQFWWWMMNSRNLFEIPVQVDKVVVDVEIADASLVVAIGDLELVGCWWKSTQLQRCRQIQEAMARLRQMRTSKQNKKHVFKLFFLQFTFFTNIYSNWKNKHGGWTNIESTGIIELNFHLKIDV